MSHSRSERTGECRRRRRARESRRWSRSRAAAQPLEESRPSATTGRYAPRLALAALRADSEREAGGGGMATACGDCRPTSPASLSSLLLLGLHGIGEPDSGSTYPGGRVASKSRTRRATHAQPGARFAMGTRMDKGLRRTRVTPPIRPAASAASVAKRRIGLTRGVEPDCRKPRTPRAATMTRVTRLRPSTRCRGPRSPCDSHNRARRYATWPQADDAYQSRRFSPLDDGTDRTADQSPNGSVSHATSPGSA